ncbi:PREDICTED: probable protein S-acyltransferase 22 isoform X1 [Tarenaya hassleriana]|uniref:probable protein S-acyltransferase 22 isoform X1 n=1 Tax=Tarenaya hassleriana TaxID=28532 RepID=UPI00053C3EE8|nr:PREDICTED: probable protein S-acyltransferase 22 isoform X1 [Tarenaya hassleriana]
MRKHGCQLPYHPLQVVAAAVFLALGFAFYVFFAPFVGKKMYQYIAMGIYTPLIACVFSLYIWCAAADPADPGVFLSKKYLKVLENGKFPRAKEMKNGYGSTSSRMHNGGTAIGGGKSLENTMSLPDTSVQDMEHEPGKKLKSSENLSPLSLLCSPCAILCHCCSRKDESSEQQTSEDGMFYCSLCEVEVFKYSKHCRVCDKCVDRFDHHCRWLNNCIGKRNYRQFFTLLVSAILLLIMQWSTGILVLVLCFLQRKQYSADISLKLGSSFSLAPFVIVVAVCSILAMLATLPLAQLFFFHILLIKKGISTYDYIVALREQEQEQEGGGGQQSPQMSMVSSLTGLSSASSFNTFHRAAWCTPPRLFLEDQFDVVPPENASVSSYGKKMARKEPVKKKDMTVKISPWTLARLNAEEVSKAAAEARKKSKILQPMMRRENPFGLEASSSFGSSGRRIFPKFDGNNGKRRASKRVRLPAELPIEPMMSNIQAKAMETSTSSALAPLQLEARSAFQTSRAMSSSGVIVASSPESSLDSPDIHPFRVSSSVEDSTHLTGLSSTLALMGQQMGQMTMTMMPLSRSTSDGYEASGGEDSDQVPSRSIHRLR